MSSDHELLAYFDGGPECSLCIEKLLKRLAAADATPDSGYLRPPNSKLQVDAIKIMLTIILVVVAEQTDKRKYNTSTKLYSCIYYYHKVVYNIAIVL